LSALRKEKPEGMTSKNISCYLKYVAMAVFVILPFFGFFLGTRYVVLTVNTKNNNTVSQPITSYIDLNMFEQ